MAAMRFRVCVGMNESPGFPLEESARLQAFPSSKLHWMASQKAGLTGGGGSVVDGSVVGSVASSVVGAVVAEEVVDEVLEGAHLKPIAVWLIKRTVQQWSFPGRWSCPRGCRQQAQRLLCRIQMPQSPPKIDVTFPCLCSGTQDKMNEGNLEGILPAGQRDLGCTWRIAIGQFLQFQLLP